MLSLGHDTMKAWHNNDEKPWWWQWKHKLGAFLQSRLPQWALLRYWNSKTRLLSPTFTTEGRPHLLQIQKQIFRRAGSPILLHISERTTFISQQYQSGGNTGVILFQENKTCKFVNTLVLWKWSFSKKEVFFPQTKQHLFNVVRTHRSKLRVFSPSTLLTRAQYFWIPHRFEAFQQRFFGKKKLKKHNRWPIDPKESSRLSPLATVSSAQSGRTSPYFEFCDEAFTE